MPQETLVFPIPPGTWKPPAHPQTCCSPEIDSPCSSETPRADFLGSLLQFHWPEIHTFLLAVSKEQNFRISNFNFSNIQSYPDTLIHL